MRQFCISIFIILAGCVPYSDNPITDANVDTMDTSLYGTWFWKKENESGFIHFGYIYKSKLLHVMMLDIKNTGELDVSEYVGHTSLLKGNRYLNLKQLRPADESPGYLIIKYVIDKGRLGISIIDNDVVRKAIKDGSLKGELTKTGWSSSVHITAGQKKLRKFVLKQDKVLFKETVYLRRLDLPFEKLGPDVDTKA